MKKYRSSKKSRLLAVRRKKVTARRKRAEAQLRFRILEEAERARRKGKEMPSAVSLSIALACVLVPASAYAADGPGDYVNAADVLPAATAQVPGSVPGMPDAAVGDYYSALLNEGAAIAGFEAEALPAQKSVPASRGSGLQPAIVASPALEGLLGASSQESTPGKVYGKTSAKSDSGRYYKNVERRSSDGVKPALQKPPAMAVSTAGTLVGEIAVADSVDWAGSAAEAAKYNAIDIAGAFVVGLSGGSSDVVDEETPAVQASAELVEFIDKLPADDADGGTDGTVADAGGAEPGGDAAASEGTAEDAVGQPEDIAKGEADKPGKGKGSATKPVDTGDGGPDTDTDEPMPDDEGADLPDGGPEPPTDAEAILPKEDDQALPGDMDSEDPGEDAEAEQHDRPLNYTISFSADSEGNIYGRVDSSAVSPGEGTSMRDEFVLRLMGADGSSYSFSIFDGARLDLTALADGYYRAAVGRAIYGFELDSIQLGGQQISENDVFEIIGGEIESPLKVNFRHGKRFFAIVEGAEFSAIVPDVFDGLEAELLDPEITDGAIEMPDPDVTEGAIGLPDEDEGTAPEDEAELPPDEPGKLEDGDGTGDGEGGEQDGSGPGSGSGAGNGSQDETARPPEEDEGQAPGEPGKLEDDGPDPGEGGLDDEGLPSGEPGKIEDGGPEPGDEGGSEGSSAEPDGAGGSEGGSPEPDGAGGMEDGASAPSSDEEDESGVAGTIPGEDNGISSSGPAKTDDAVLPAGPAKPEDGGI